ncbi:UDP-Glycosyltransferase [Musa troglodytarum]|uniref:UDP-Glycosyltransferase n=1 Tax=Musa troglodytarum TaxID=320322 RepID=A0A9E7KMX5_9LILI|nr:UDP-Glycosyltransferase [Musa troglodytarum]
MSFMSTRKPHAVCIPYPAQGHVTPMMMLAKLLHSHGFHITFVNTQYNHSRLLRSKALSSADVLPDFRFESIPDGLPPSDEDATQDIPSLCDSIQNNALPPFLDLLRQLNEGSPPVTCVVSNGAMSFTLDAAKELSIPEVIFWTPSACGIMGYLHYKHLLERGLTPLKDESDITNGYLDMAVEWIPGLKNMRLKDLPTFIRTTDPDDIMLNYCNREAQRASMAKAVIMNTFDELEQPVLEAMAAMLPPIYTVGPLTLLSRRAPDSPLTSVRSNLWKEESGCLEWLHGRAPASVVYVNFGSITVMTNTQLVEFAWGLANCKYEFLWVIRPDLVKGDAAVLPEEFLEETKGRGLLASWCPQEAVLAHSSVGGFLTHSGWNSTIESISNGVAMLSWPFFAEQQTNCRYACTEWGVGMEIDNDVKREEVEALIRELMGGEKGKEMRKKAAEWKERAVRATQPGGSSFLNLDRLVNEVLCFECM